MHNLKNFELYVAGKDSQEKQDIEDLFWYMITLYGEWSIEKFVTQNLEYLSHPHFLCIALLGPLSTHVAKDLVQDVDKTLEKARKFFNSVNPPSARFDDLDSVKKAIQLETYKRSVASFCKQKLV